MIGDIIKRGHIHALDLRGVAQKLELGRAFFLVRDQQVNQLVGDLLPLAGQENVEEIRQGFGIAYAGAPADDQRCERRAVARTQGHIAEIQHIEHVRIAQFILQRKADQIKL